MFQQAMTLMSQRCASTANPAPLSRDIANPTPLVAFKNPSFGSYMPTYFYINQKKPQPMEPLKAWKGYHGNVYFEPIQIGQAKVSAQQEAGTKGPEPDHCSKELQEILARSRKSNSSRNSSHRGPMSNGASSPGDEYSAYSRQSRARTGTAKSTSSSSMKYKGPRQMAILDKRKVLHEHENDEYLSEDVAWVMGRENTGSLCLTSNSKPSSAPSMGRHSACQLSPQARKTMDKKPPNKEKICKGSVAHKIYTMKGRSFPLLSVIGDKFSQNQLPSPLLRTQTQYSQSSTRMTMSSPDSYGSTYSPNFDKLPPLEQLRASLRHIEHGTQTETSPMHVPQALIDRARTGSSNTNNMAKQTPLIKFSPEVKKVTSLPPGMSGHPPQRQKVK